MEAPIKGFLKTYRIDGEKGRDQKTFISYIKPQVINFLYGRKKPFQVQFIFTCKFKKGVPEEEKVYSNGHFRTKIERVMEATDLMEMYERMAKESLEKIEKFQKEGSGWRFVSVESFDINVDPFKPLRGSSYFPLPPKLAAKKAIINVQNKKDNECFKWAVTSAVFQRKAHPKCLNRELRDNSVRLNWKGIDFPTPLTQITRFEKQNPFYINVFGWDGRVVYPLRISKFHAKDKENIDLILLSYNGNQHYCWIKNMSALVASQVNRHKGKIHLCHYCLNSLPTEKSLEKHLEYCSNHKAVKVEMMNKGTMLTPKGRNRKIRVLFVTYADFEAFTVPISTCSPSDDKSYTKQYQKHTRCSFCYYIKWFQ